MALGMKHWIGLLVAAVAFIMVGQLPPDAYTARPAEAVPHEDVRMRALGFEVRIAEAVLKRVRWNDRFTTELFENSEDGLAVGTAGMMGEEALDAYRDHIAQGLLSAPTREANALVSVYWVDAREGSYRRGPSDMYGTAIEYYIGQRDGRPYCMNIRPSGRQYMRDYMDDRRMLRRTGLSSQFGSGVGACRFVAQYGMPGDEILEWLGVGGLAFGYGWDVRQRDRTYRWGSRGPFGRSYWSNAGQRIRLDQCMAGSETACLDIALDPLKGEGMMALRVGREEERRIAQESPVTTMGRRTDLATPGSFIFMDLEDEFGHEAFDRFWSSELSVEDAFESAFGVEMAEWFTQWMAANIGHFRSGPGLTQSARFGGLLTIMVFGLLAAGRNRRRKVA